MRDLRFCAVLLIVAAAACGEAPGSCSTFMLRTQGGALVGHNLDESPDLQIPGLVCVNKRNVYRESLTWFDLIADPPDYERVTIPFEEKPSPKINWVSRYASITFNSEGVDFPDGGMNEKGLSIFEMSMGRTRFPEDSEKPTLFICQWIQYQLDNYALVEEVVQHVDEINQQGWAWHYFVADGTGDFAIIEFIDGEVVIHRGAEAPVPALCNLSYEEELALLDDEQGLWGRIRSWIGRSPRFVRAAGLLRDYDATTHPDARAYAMDILEEIRVPGWNKWQVLVDPINLVASFRTTRNRNIRYIHLRDVDLSAGTPTLILDIHGDGSGDMTSKLEPYSYERNLVLTRERAKWLFKERFAGLIDNGVTAEVYARRFADYSERIRNTDPETR